MITPRTLAHPPIKEAVLEVLFKFPDSVNLKFLNEYRRLISSQYPIRENILIINANISDENQAVSRRSMGYVNFSNDRKTSLQIRLNGFAFAQTNESYSSWESFKPVAFKELQAFIDFMGPSNITRFSLRFINEIKIPPNNDLKEYLNILPNVDSLNLPIRNLASRVELDKSDIGAIAIVSLLFSPPFDPAVNIYLDIDVIMNVNSSETVDINSLSEKFDILRKLKNEIFFSALTQKAIDSYS